MKNIYHLLSTFSLNFQSATLLLIRLVLAYGFYETAVPKWQNIEPTAQWFASIGIPFPVLSIYLVAIFGVHFENGYSLANNGFEVPLYYLCMIFVLFSFGGGNISLDKIIFKNDQ
ncbi:DoxX family protein [Campylobacter hyointestinalis]|uniref:DoxX family protein n=1 Tax=Campylobacter hyointestinalis TaxID=198 RepID=UPI0007269C0F|nr:DoxX family protein [Campylobacter hyointestinalis]CUU86848.1 integral membrane protein [Campylobacter hyointestinalis subsp. hyointestinalis]